MAFDTIPPKATLKPEPFTAHVSDQDLNDFKTLLRLSKIGPKTYENQIAKAKEWRSFGISREWLEGAKKHWETDYSWRKTEDRINSFPNYKAKIDEEGFTFEVHFAALFSKKADAPAIMMAHGWPGSFLEFLGVLEELRTKYTEDTLPFSVVVPNLPGYGYSNGPPLDKDFTVEGIAKVIDKLMIGLGFGDGYISQGGDLGSFVARVLGVTSSACKATHLNMSMGPVPTKEDFASFTERQRTQFLSMIDYRDFGSAYSKAHATRPATIGLALSSSPLALLCWIGEKFLAWTDDTPPLDEILDSVSLYWFTECYPTSIYGYRQFWGEKPQLFHPDPAYFLKKPLGYSLSPKELSQAPPPLIAKTGNLVWSREHETGGHFAAMENPKVFAQDMEDFVKQVWTQEHKAKF